MYMYMHVVTCLVKFTFHPGWASGTNSAMVKSRFSSTSKPRFLTPSTNDELATWSLDSPASRHVKENTLVYQRVAEARSGGLQ